MRKYPHIPDKEVVDKIYYFRGQKVMLDEDLAELYHEETRRLNEQVRRNISRFPEDFMFQLNAREHEILISQNATSRWGGRRKLPLVFTEHGVLMLSSVLNSRRAIQVNIQIMRVFTRMRQMIMTHKDVLLKLEQLEKSVSRHDEQIRAVFESVKQLLVSANEPRRKIGYRIKGR